MAKGRAQGIRAGRAFVEFGADDSELQRVMRRSSARLKAFAAGMVKIGAGVAAAGAAILAPLTAATVSLVSVGTALDDMSKRTRLSVETLSELGYAAERSGSSLESLEAAMYRMNRRIANASTESGPAVRALKDLGIEAEAFSKLGMDAQLKILADRLNGLNNPALAAQYAFEVLGDNAKDLIQLLRRGSAGIEQLQARARELGIVIDSDTVSAASALGDALGDLRLQARAVAIAVGAAVAPAVTKLARTLSPLVGRVIELVRNNKAMVTGAATAGVVLVGLGTAFVLLGTGIGLAAFALGGFATLLSPAALSIAGIVALVASLATGTITLAAALVQYTTVGRTALIAMGITWTHLQSRAMAVIGAIRNALMAGDLGAAVEVAWASVNLAWEIGKSALLDSAVGFGAAFLSVINTIIGQVLTSVYEAVDWVVQHVLKAVDAIAGTDYAGTMGNMISAGLGILGRQAKISTDQRNETLKLLRDLYQDLNTDAPIDAARKRLEEAIRRANELAADVAADRLSNLDFDGSLIQRGIDTFGSFGGGRLDQQFGSAGNIGSRQLDEQKKIARNTAQVARALDNLSARLAFS